MQEPFIQSKILKQFAYMKRQHRNISTLCSRLSFNYHFWQKFYKTNNYLSKLFSLFSSTLFCCQFFNVCQAKYPSQVTNDNGINQWAFLYAVQCVWDWWQHHQHTSRAHAEQTRADLVASCVSCGLPFLKREDCTVVFWSRVQHQVLIHLKQKR